MQSYGIDLEEHIMIWSRRTSKTLPNNREDSTHLPNIAGSY